MGNSHYEFIDMKNIIAHSYAGRQQVTKYKRVMPSYGSYTWMHATECSYHYTLRVYGLNQLTADETPCVRHKASMWRVDDLVRRGASSPFALVNNTIIRIT